VTSAAFYTQNSTIDKRRFHSGPRCAGGSLHSGYLSAAPFRAANAFGRNMGRLFGFLHCHSTGHWLVLVIPSRCRALLPLSGRTRNGRNQHHRSEERIWSGIASAERRYSPAKEICFLDELISTNYIAVARQRPPYTYEVQDQVPAVFVSSLPLRRQHVGHTRAAFGRREHGVSLVRIGFGRWLL